jgi:hypothetical protein
VGHLCGKGRIVRGFIVAAVTIAALAVPAAATSATGSTPCTGDIGAVVIPTNLNVPAGATCRLFGTEVQGNISVGTGATLHTFGFTADRNVSVNGGFFVDNNWGFLIKGNLSIDGSQGDPTSCNNGFWSDYSASEIMGNFSYTNNLGWFCAQSNGGFFITVDGNFTYSGNGRPYTGGLTFLGASNIS